MKTSAQNFDGIFKVKLLRFTSKETKRNYCVLSLQL